MKIICFLSFLLIIFFSPTITSCAKSGTNIGITDKRDPLKRPFSITSIWNMPLHHRAVYKDAQLQASPIGFHVDENIIILTPNENYIDVFTNHAGWSPEKDRCRVEGELLFTAPIPESFIYSPSTWLGRTPNSAAAILMNDGRTIRQTQPFSKCKAESQATSEFVYETVDLYGNGRPGAHGGSALSSIGGTIRLGELVPGGKIQHAIKLELYAAKYLYYDDQTEGYRWPAFRADGYAKGNYGTLGNPEQECRMGALLALPPEIDIDGLDLETEPAKIVAQALKDYGGYVVDDTAWDTYYFCVEHSPQGRVSEEFEKVWGFPIEAPSGTPWADDMAKIFTKLCVVVNNDLTYIGGGPTNDLENRRTPVATDLDDTSIILPN